MATLFRNLSALVFDGFTTAERDALNVQERMMLFNITTGRFEIFLAGAWYGLLLLDVDGNISSAQHGALGGDLHPEYAQIAAPEEITGGWLLKSGGSLKATAGDPPAGEIAVQIKTTAGAPTHSASEGVLCWVAPRNAFYVNNGGGTVWQLVSAAIVQATAPPTPDTGQIWLDTSTSGTGTASLALVTKTEAYTATDSDAVILCNATAGAFSITLPTAVGRAGRIFTIKKTDSTGNAVTVDGDGAETIDGATTQVIATQYNSITIISDGSEWHIT